MASTIGTHEMDASIRCPACRASGTFHTWDIIDAGDVSLKDRVLFDENLFFYTCPHCQSKIHIESKCL